VALTQLSNSRWQDTINQEEEEDKNSTAPRCNQKFVGPKKNRTDLEFLILFEGNKKASWFSNKVTTYIAKREKRGANRSCTLLLIVIEIYVIYKKRRSSL
jgi:hypothetical protein